LKGPELASGFQVDAVFLGAMKGAVSRIGRAHFNPGLDQRDFGIREFAFGRHFQIGIVELDGFKQQTFGG